MLSCDSQTKTVHCMHITAELQYACTVMEAYNCYQHTDVIDGCCMQYCTRRHKLQYGGKSLDMDCIQNIATIAVLHNINVNVALWFLLRPLPQEMASHFSTL